MAGGMAPLRSPAAAGGWRRGLAVAGRARGVGEGEPVPAVAGGGRGRHLAWQDALGEIWT